MTTTGWIVMILSVGFVLCLVAYCFYRVLFSSKTTEHMHAPLEIDTRDTDT